MIYRTLPADVAPPIWAGATTVEPLRDSLTGLYARLTYRDALAVAKALGARLPTRADVIARRSRAMEIEPVCLPTSEMLEGVALHDVQAFRDANMASREWAEIHDAEVQARLAARKWDGAQVVCNAGKHWIVGAGRARICGWWQLGAFTQAGLRDQHGLDYTDYATTTILMRG